MKVLIISGPSGVGKSSIAKLLASSFPEKYEVVKSVTTRMPRENESGEEYTYLSEESFRILERSGNFLEVASYGGNGCFYATPRDELVRIFGLNKVPVLVIDVAGKKQICSKKNEHDFEVISIFVIVSAEQVYKRLLDRGESIESIITRMSASIEEAAEGMTYDAIINNVDVKKSVDQIESMLDDNRSIKETLTLQRYIAEVPEIIRRLDNRDSISSLMLRVDQFCMIREWNQSYQPPFQMGV